MYNFNLSIIIPCSNESKNLTKLIPEIKSCIGKKFSFEILIIDGMNVDKKTKLIAKNIRLNISTE